MFLKCKTDCMTMTRSRLSSFIMKSIFNPMITILLYSTRPTARLYDGASVKLAKCYWELNFENVSYFIPIAMHSDKRKRIFFVGKYHALLYEVTYKRRK